jgi:hypothetical protein
MPEAIIRDPKQNERTEADFGILMDVTQENFGKYYLYSKGPLAQGNPKRYWTAGTEVKFNGPVKRLEKNYLWNSQFNNLQIDSWVKIRQDPDTSTGPVVNKINEMINDKDLPFPSTKEFLRDYAFAEDLAEETAMEDGV